MKIAILGSTGFLGKVLLEKASNAGYQVRTLVREPAKLGQFRDRVELVEGNIFRASDIEEAVLGTEAVLSTVGPPQRNPKHPEKHEQAMEDLVAAMENLLASSNDSDHAPEPERQSQCFGVRVTVR